MEMCADPTSPLPPICPRRSTQGKACSPLQGDLDLVVGMQLPHGVSEGGVRVYLNPSGAMDRYFRDVTPLDVSGVAGQDTTSIVLADLNGDQWLDLVVGNSGEGQTNYFYINPGNGRFDLVAKVALGATDFDQTQSLVVADFNHDNVMDIVVGNRGQPNKIYFGALSESTYTVASSLMISTEIDNTYAVASGDLNLDTFPDVVVGNYEQENKVPLRPSLAAPAPLPSCTALYWVSGVLRKHIWFEWPSLV